jgi:ArsR family transcriptional regulator
MQQFSAEVADQDLEQLTSLFRLLSDKTRLTILFLLAEGERNVTSLCDELSLPQPTVSHHLGLLRVNNVIGNRRKGKQVFYALNGRVTSSASAELELAVEHYRVKIGPAVAVAMV